MFGKLFAKTGPKPMDQAAFARHIGDHISRNFAQANQVRADAPNFELHITDPQGETQTIFLHNAYQHYLGAFEDGPEQVEAYLRDYLAALAEMDRGSPEHLAENLVPLLRHVGYNPEQKSWSAPFAGDLGVMLGFDSPHNLSYVANGADLAGRGLGLPDTHALPRYFQQLPVAKRPGAPAGHAPLPWRDLLYLGGPRARRRHDGRDPAARGR